MKRILTLLFLSLVVFYTTSNASAQDYRKLCENFPPDKASYAAFLATDDDNFPSYVHVGDTKSFLKGRDNVYLVNQHNGHRIVIKHFCEGQ